MPHPANPIMENLMDCILEFHCLGPCHSKVYPAIMGKNGAGSSGGSLVAALQRSPD